MATDMLPMYEQLLGLGVVRLVVVHQLGAPLVDDAGEVGDPDVLARQPELDEQAEAGEPAPARHRDGPGRNQHRVGFGSIAEFPGPFPGYTANKPKSCAGLPRILKENGYVTGGFGKWHLTPDNVQGAAGPFDHWPMSWGFDHWWGFLTGAAGQYDPIITQDNSVLGVPEGKDGKLYYFPDDITDKAVEWLHAAGRVSPLDAGLDPTVVRVAAVDAPGGVAFGQDALRRANWMLSSHISNTPLAVLEWDRDPDPREIFTTGTYLDARDDSLLEWIAASQISALVADNYAVEGLLGDWNG
mgnify:CR=1 FL=1